MLLNRLPVVFGSLVVGLLVSATSSFAQQQFAVGSHVEVDPTEMGNFQGGTLVEIDKKTSSYVVDLDAGYQVRIPFKEQTYKKKDYIRMPGANPADGAAGNAGVNANAGGNGNAAMNGGMPNRAVAPQRAQQPAGQNRQMMPAQVRADGALTEEIVKRLISAEVPDRPGVVNTYQWGRIQIAPPRPSAERDVYQAVPFGVQVYEVQAEYTHSMATGMGQQPLKQDHRQTFSFWKDATGNWTYQRKAVPSNYTSDSYH